MWRCPIVGREGQAGAVERGLNRILIVQNQ
jgi:hypothetical protein